VRLRTLGPGFTELASLQTVYAENSDELAAALEALPALTVCTTQQLMHAVPCHAR
jgi:hypothetical protein